ncbi:MAG: hypothetical protein M3Z26_01000 [Bacteroidota bacterium]|nr:hypothetical protein [Bacteroidota bacterium]
MKKKEDFLKNDFIPLLRQLKPGDKGLWGVMNAQQMIEHFTDAVKNASGKLLLPELVKGEKLTAMRDFVMSEKPFEENIDNPLMEKEGAALRQPDIQSAIEKLQSELDFFFLAFKKDPDLKTKNPFFGELDYKMNIQFLHKHAQHHLRQFGLA